MLVDVVSLQRLLAPFGDDRLEIALTLYRERYSTGGIYYCSVYPAVPLMLDGWRDASETFNVTLELVKRGYSESQIAQLWSGNLLRVMDKVQAVAKELQRQKK